MEDMVMLALFAVILAGMVVFLLLVGVQVDSLVSAVSGGINQ